jgi:hypothetical protein
LLERLKIINCGGLLWHLDDLATSSVLKELHCKGMKGTPVKGNIKMLGLRV